ncbi:MAG: glycogen debranching N-terminal domain-containing protein, partial [Lapillicoccus sp.]
LDVELAGERSAPVAHGALGAHAEFFGSARSLGSTNPDPVVEVRRSRDLVAGGLVERVDVVSRADRQVTGALRLRVAADGAPIATVKSGLTDLARLVPTLSASGAVFGDEWHETRIALDPAPARLVETDGAVEAWFDLDLGPGDVSEVVLRVTTTRHRRSNLDADPGGSRVRWPLRVTGDDPRLERTADAAVADLQALVLTDPEAPGDMFAAAGTPWYLTLFGRDSIWAAQLTLPLGTDLARGTLRALGRRQGVRHDPLSGEVPGKIPHEVRRVPYVDPATGMSLPAVYFGSVDATALWVVLLHDAWRWGLAADAVRELVDVLDAAVGWLTGDAVPDADGLLKYLDDTGLGLSNQGWKDSGDAIRFRDGRLGGAPIALVEAQAYTVHALECAATLADAFGRDGADDLRKRAEDLRGRVRDHYWVTDEVDAEAARPALGRYLGLAVDGSGRLVDGLASNMGHVLGTSTLTRDEAALVAAALTGPELLDRFGVRTLGTDNGGYNPIGYHTGSIWTHDTAIAALGLAAEGFRSEAVTVATTLLASAEAFGYRWPELYSGEPLMGRPAPYPAACRPQAWSAASAVALLTVALGLRPDAQSGTLHVHPTRPAAYGAMRVEGLRLGPGEVDLDVAADGEVTVTRATGGVTVVVHGSRSGAEEGR